MANAKFLSLTTSLIESPRGTQRLKANEMYNPIEIPDSDDELAEPSSRVKQAVTSGSEASEPTPEKKRKISMSAAAKSTDVLMVKSTESLSSDTTSSPPSSSSANQTKPQVRHRARKTQHTVRNAAAENEIQFESIVLDNDTKEKEISAAQEQEQKELRLPSESDPIKNTVNQFMASDEVQQIIQRIANERVRCNFLLATYKLPDMNFMLNTHTDMLKFQFRERLKQRKERATTATTTTTTNAPGATVKK